MNTEALIKKYKRYISNVQWHIDTNKPLGSKVMELQDRIKHWQEVVNDLEASATLTATPLIEPMDYTEKLENALYPLHLEMSTLESEWFGKGADFMEEFLKKVNISSTKLPSTELRSAEEVARNIYSEFVNDHEDDNWKQFDELHESERQLLYRCMESYASQFRSNPSADDPKV